MIINKHIEIVRSGTPRLSSMGLKSSMMLCEVLSRFYRQVGISFVNNQEDLLNLIEMKPDLVFLGFKNMPSDKSKNKMVWIAEELEANQINFLGSTVPAIKLDHDKGVAKEVIQEARLLTAPFFVAGSDYFKNSKEIPLDFPLFVKPTQEGGGNGIDDDSVVRDFKTLQQKIKSIERDFGTLALVEKYLVGREFSVALMKSNFSDEILAMPVELLSKPNERGDRLLSQKVKADDTEHVCAIDDEVLKETLMSLSLECFKAIGARDYGRIDFRMDESGRLYFLEANLIPGVAQHEFTSYFISACQINLGMSYQQMILQLVEIGLSHTQVYTPDLSVDDSVLLSLPRETEIVL